MSCERLTPSRDLLIEDAREMLANGATPEETARRLGNDVTVADIERWFRSEGESAARRVREGRAV